MEPNIYLSNSSLHAIEIGFIEGLCYQPLIPVSRKCSIFLSAYIGLCAKNIKCSHQTQNVAHRNAPQLLLTLLDNARLPVSGRE